MTHQDVDIVLYYQNEDQALLSIVGELDELGVDYEECRIGDAPPAVQACLASLGGGSPASPTVSINGEMMPRPTAANVMSAIMHARSAGFYL